MRTFLALLASLLALAAVAQQPQPSPPRDESADRALFNRIDTRLAHDSRQEIYAFLSRYLK